jgi:hypothetical protein
MGMPDRGRNLDSEIGIQCFGNTAEVRANWLRGGCDAPSCNIEPPTGDFAASPSTRHDLRSMTRKLLQLGQSR